MATEAENLQQARENIAARLEEITRSPKPSYSIDGQTVSWTEYFEALLRQRTALDDALQQEEGPFEIHQRGVT